MVTLVGTQNDLRKALENLVELDYAAPSCKKVIESLKTSCTEAVILPGKTSRELTYLTPWQQLEIGICRKIINDMSSKLVSILSVFNVFKKNLALWFFIPVRFEACNLKLI